MLDQVFYYQSITTIASLPKNKSLKTFTKKSLGYPETNIFV